ncbi:MAG: PTS system mannose/fructose/sorbose family transporter subunit IID [Gemmatimonadetes bacterium]|nr:PTS system mannose/fructose/sorbose family transporter subunit IID [Gemmatimonadota bacterium]
MKPRASVRIAMFLRSFAIQGSWNYRSMIGGGFAFALLPALRMIYHERPAALRDALERHRALFNSHPYLVGVALGAVARLESEGVDAGTVDRFKSAVRGSLGSLGDGLVWAGWRPVWTLVALVLLHGGFPWWIAVLTFLVGYNAGHLALRGWGFHVGYHHGLAVAGQLKRAHMSSVGGVLAAIGAAILGALLPLLIAAAPPEPAHPAPWLAAAVVACLLGLRYGNRVRLPAVVAVLGVALFAAVARVLA